jgi:hypothetical protein
MTSRKWLEAGTKTTAFLYLGAKRSVAGERNITI